MTLASGTKYVFFSGKTISKERCCSFDADDARKTVFPCHDGAVGYEPTELRGDSAQKRKVWTPTDVCADGDQDVSLHWKCVKKRGLQCFNLWFTNIVKVQADSETLSL